MLRSKPSIRFNTNNSSRVDIGKIIGIRFVPSLSTYPFSNGNNGNMTFSMNVALGISIASSAYVDDDTLFVHRAKVSSNGNKIEKEFIFFGFDFFVLSYSHYDGWFS